MASETVLGDWTKERGGGGGNAPAPGRLLPVLIDTKDSVISLYPEGSSSVCETDFYKMF